MSLARYLLACIPARITTGGVAVTTILLAKDNAMDGTTTGAMVACLSAPHFLGPLYGRWLDICSDSRMLIASACLLFTLSYLAVITGFAMQSLSISIVALLICGACSSFMMGGLSSQMGKFINLNTTHQRYAQSWDNMSYSLGLTIGPLLTAILASHTSIQLATCVIIGLPAFSGGIIVVLPKPCKTEPTAASAVPSLKQILTLLRQSKPLKRTLIMTASAAFSVASLPILAVYLSDFWGRGAEQGAYLVTLYGIGCLCGAVMLIIFPLYTNALLLLRNVGGLLLLALCGVAFSHSFAFGLISYWFCGFINAIFFAVTLAARTEYAPKQAATQVYMWVAAIKIGCASLGAYIAGLLIDVSTSWPIVVSLGILAIALVVCFAIRKRALLQMS